MIVLANTDGETAVESVSILASEITGWSIMGHGTAWSGRFPVKEDNRSVRYRYAPLSPRSMDLNIRDSTKRP
jgi:hypothetical protein